MIKREELVKGCISRAADEEPVFVLRAQDALAPAIVEFWIDLVNAVQSVDGPLRAKLAEAGATAQAMRDWHTRKLPD